MRGERVQGLLRLDLGPRSPKIGQKCPHFLPQRLDFRPSDLRQPLGMCFGWQAPRVRVRSRAVFAALKLSDHPGAPENTKNVHNFCPTRSQSWLACGQIERRILPSLEFFWQAPGSRAPPHRGVMHLRNAKGGCFGGLRRRGRPKSGQNRAKRLKNGRYQGREGQTGAGHSTSRTPPHCGSRPRAHARRLL